MSLQSRLTLLIQAIGADIKALLARPTFIVLNKNDPPPAGYTGVILRRPT